MIKASTGALLKARLYANTFHACYTFHIYLIINFKVSLCLTMAFALFLPVICHVVGITYQTIHKSILAELLGNVPGKELNTLMLFL